ncbi:YggS family pyridoxal phosphate-dependent enzyme [Bacillus sp. D386]|uniref:YggS family pyridoxal phosphate-dependent enzyme n=1 Tax=Bacillus sp. D386 TaxID=2587155 RepID=UPI0011214EA9|nr:YggS family pyridoxal phosphate-dependent enzyme [Bacillus sp. D386]
MEVTENLQIIHEKIESAAKRAGRNPQDIQIIAVTKYVSTKRALEAYKAGIKNFGENRSEGLIAKQEGIKERPVWHFIGSLQTRKVKTIINRVDVLHSLDRLSLAEEIEKRATRPIDCFVQINVSGEDTKHGIQPQIAIEFVQQLAEFEKIRVMGLMTMAPFTDDEEEIRTCFRKLKELQVVIQNMKLPNAPCTELSMGMSNDYEIAIEEGATMVRIGTALVGNE